MSDSLRQQREILDHLKNNQSLTTLYARDVMGIMHPGGRVLELRKSGINIETHWISESDAAGGNHRTAKYVLMTGKPDSDQNQQGLFDEGGLDVH